MHLPKSRSVADGISTKYSIYIGECQLIVPGGVLPRGRGTVNVLRPLLNGSFHMAARKPEDPASSEVARDLPLRAGIWARNGGNGDATSGIAICGVFCYRGARGTSMGDTGLGVMDRGPRTLDRVTGTLEKEFRVAGSPLVSIGGNEV